MSKYYLLSNNKNLLSSIVILQILNLFPTNQAIDIYYLYLKNVPHNSIHLILMDHRMVKH